MILFTSKKLRIYCPYIYNVLKGTFVDKLPSWSETSKDVNPPDAYLNANTTGEKCVEIYSEVQALKSKY